MLDVSALDSIEDGSQLNQLSKTRLTAVQRALAVCAYPVGAVDGLHGPRTRNAYAEFVTDGSFGDTKTVTAQVIDHFNDKVSKLRSILDAPSGSKDQVKERIGEMFTFIGLHYKAHIAYGLATAQWETAHTFEPVKEAFWLSETWRRKNLRYYPFYGRGYVQLTWDRNYRLYSSIIGLDMVSDPDLALRHDVALFVIAHGMKMGSFTERKLEDYIFLNHTDFIKARRVINGNNKAQEIAELAESYMDTL